MEKVVYVHRNPKTLEVFYVGSGTKNRAGSVTNRNADYMNYVKECGRPIVEMVAKNISEEDALELEELITLEYGRICDGAGLLVNVKSGNSLTENMKQMLRDLRKGTKASEETKRKQSAIAKKRGISPETRRKMTASQKGVKRSEETRRRMSKSQIGKKLSDETKDKMSKSRLGLIVVNNGKTNKRIKSSDLQEGWTRGFIKRIKN